MLPSGCCNLLPSNTASRDGMVTHCHAVHSNAKGVSSPAAMQSTEGACIEHGAQGACIERGARSTEHGAQGACIEHGAQSTEHGARSTGCLYRAWSTEHRARSTEHRVLVRAPEQAAGSGANSQYTYCLPRHAQGMVPTHRPAQSHDGGHQEQRAQCHHQCGWQDRHQLRL